MALYKRYVQFRYLHTHFLALEKSIRASALRPLILTLYKYSYLLAYLLICNYQPWLIGNESLPKIIINNTTNLYCNRHFANFKP